MNYLFCVVSLLLVFVEKVNISLFFGICLIEMYYCRNVFFNLILLFLTVATVDTVELQWLKY